MKNKLVIENIMFNSNFELKTFIERVFEKLGYDFHEYNVFFDESIDNDDDEIIINTEFEYISDYRTNKVSVNFEYDEIEIQADAYKVCIMIQNIVLEVYNKTKSIFRKLGGGEIVKNQSKHL